MRNLLFISILFIFSCQSALDQELLYGSWKAAAFLEEGEKSSIDLSMVQFDFQRDGTYAYHGTLQPEENGRFYIVGKLLFTTDTTAVKPLEKSVKIIQLTNDSLHFQMNAGGTSQVFKLYKQ